MGNTVIKCCLLTVSILVNINRASDVILSLFTLPILEIKLLGFPLSTPASSRTSKSPPMSSSRPYAYATPSNLVAEDAGIPVARPIIARVARIIPGDDREYIDSVLYNQNPRGLRIQDTVCNSPLDFFSVYLDHVQSVLHFPLLPLIIEVLGHYGIALTQLVPNAIRVIVGFERLCRSRGLVSSLALFRAFFYLKSSGNEGWYQLPLAQANLYGLYSRIRCRSGKIPSSSAEFLRASNFLGSRDQTRL